MCGCDLVTKGPKNRRSPGDLYGHRASHRHGNHDLALRRSEREDCTPDRAEVTHRLDGTKIALQSHSLPFMIVSGPSVVPRLRPNVHLLLRPPKSTQTNSGEIAITKTGRPGTRLDGERWLSRPLAGPEPRRETHSVRYGCVDGHSYGLPSNRRFDSPARLASLPEPHLPQNQKRDHVEDGIQVQPLSALTDGR